MDRQLSEFQTVELKALAYDQLAQIEVAQNNLRAINQELSRRLQSSSVPPNSVKSTIDPLIPGSIQTI